MSISGHTTCLDAYLASFEQTFAARNYKPATLENYRHHLRRFGRLRHARSHLFDALRPDRRDRTSD